MDYGSDSDGEIPDYDIDDEIDEPFPWDLESDQEDNNEEEEEEAERIYLNKAQDMEWTSKFHETGWDKNRQKFSESEGSFNVDPMKIRTPKDAFVEFVDAEMLESITKYTNAEAVAAGDSKFKPVSSDEFLAWMSCSVAAGLMGANHTGARALWTTDTVYGSGFFRSVMSLERYQAICKYVRFDDSVARRTPRQYGDQAKPTYTKSADRLAPIRPILELFRKNFRDKYSPGENVAVDERIVSFRGRVEFRVYSKGKPDPYGIKVFGLSDADSAYFSTFDVYTGKVGNTAEVGQGKRVVLQLTEPYIGSGRRVVFDNFFTSIPLCEELVERNLPCIGTLRKNKREIPVVVQDALKDTARENKHVIMLSTDPTVIPSEPIAEPAVVEMYNKYKGGVDLTDQFIKTCGSHIQALQILIIPIPLQKNPIERTFGEEYLTNPKHPLDHYGFSCQPHRD
ncbi:piggyBac transposable element-derived protein 4-like [Culex pipiens pallens]|uniref:piggyBac transposable element-derived protein 4-like n=1 Tax=Culex pipiens pallens TaxID=42434 RepID=UPI00195376DF|nr:piggyBac transposable element-derived protein 4-like [Culex pipiens pallens]